MKRQKTDAAPTKHERTPKADRFENWPGMTPAQIADTALEDVEKMGEIWFTVKDEDEKRLMQKAIGKRKGWDKITLLTLQEYNDRIRINHEQIRVTAMRPNREEEGFVDLPDINAASASTDDADDQPRGRRRRRSKEPDFEAAPPPDMLPGESEYEYRVRLAREKREAKAKKR